MKIALVKQLYDMHGPWTTLRWQDTSPQDLITIWPGRALFWSMTVLLQADWYVVPQQLTTWHTLFSGANCSPDREIFSKYTRNLCQPQDIPYDNYDVVISLDPCLKPPHKSRTLFTYYLGEHGDMRYPCALQRPETGYDLFLAHRMENNAVPDHLPQAVAFPYLWETAITREVIRDHSVFEDAIMVEWRTLALLMGSRIYQGSRVQQPGQPASIGISETTARQAAQRMSFYLGRPVHYHLLKAGLYNRLPDPPLWGDMLHYLRTLASCRFYVSMFSYGSGQALVDAATVGSIVFGSPAMPFHRKVCHPACLCENLVEFPRQVQRVTASSDLQAEVLAWQDAALAQHFNKNPLNVLSQALEMKRRG